MSRAWAIVLIPRGELTIGYVVSRVFRRETGGGFAMYVVPPLTSRLGHHHEREDAARGCATRQRCSCTLMAAFRRRVTV